jgi:hypothetical protein
MDGESPFRLPPDFTENAARLLARREVRSHLADSSFSEVKAMLLGERKQDSEHPNGSIDATKSQETAAKKRKFYRFW